MRIPRRALVGTVVLLVVCTATGSKLKSAPPPYVATVHVRTEAPGVAVNRRVLGNNLHWVDDADGLLEHEETTWEPRLLELARQMGPTVLRYPGGSQADTYHWRDGLGPAAARGTNEHFFTGQKQKVMLGTVEFLSLCRELGAEPLVTVNVASGTAAEAAAWVRAVNVTGMTAADGTRLGPVHFWEIGNEPYLAPDQQKKLHLSPEEFVTRANAWIRAMKQADPSIEVGIPLRSDRLGVVLATPFQGFASKVLAGVTEPFEFVALHNAYLPFLLDPKQRVSEDDLFRASMASGSVLEADLAATRALLKELQPDRSIRLAITEYNAQYTMGGDKDNYIVTLTGALVVADLLRVFAGTDDLLMANYWSLCGNGWYGAVSSRGDLRPAFHVLRAANEVLRGRMLPAEVAGPRFDAPAGGIVPATRDVPALVALATLEDNRLRLLLINRDLARPAEITLEGPSGPVAEVKFREFGGTILWAAKGRPAIPEWQDRAVQGQACPLRFRLEPHALGVLEMRLGGS